MAIDVTQAMDLTQAMHTIRWLDEERRKDKALVAVLEERVREQARQLAVQEVQTQGLQMGLAGMQTELSRMNEFEQMISNFKAELVFQMERRDETRRKEQTESERLRRIEYEALVDHMHRLGKELQVMPRYDEELSTRRAEDQRLAEGLQRVAEQTSDLDKRYGERVQSVAYLEEQRRADNRRIVELEQDTTELSKKIESVAVKLPLLDDRIRKQEPRIEEVIQETKKYEKGGFKAGPPE